MTDYWRAHDFERVILIDAKDFDDAGQEGAYVDSTLFSDAARDAFSRAVLEGSKQAADAAMSGTLTACSSSSSSRAQACMPHGAKSHNLYPGDNPRRKTSPRHWSAARWRRRPGHWCVPI